MLLFDLNLFLQAHTEQIQSLLFNVMMFVAFLVILNLITNKIKQHIEAVYRNTEYMKQDFRTMKKEFEITREHIDTLKNSVDVLGTVYKNLYDTPSHLKNEFIVIKNKTMQLSAQGYIVSREIGLREMVNENWDKILPYLNDSRDNHSNHPYDLHVYCLYIGSCIDLFFAADDILRIKHYAFQEGHLVSAYFSIIGIIIKEQYFEENEIRLEKFFKLKNS